MMVHCGIQPGGIIYKLTTTITYIYCADSALATLAKEEGFSVINPEEHPEIKK